jgi:hypothetical protein
VDVPEEAKKLRLFLGSSNNSGPSRRPVVRPNFPATEIWPSSFFSSAHCLKSVGKALFWLTRLYHEDEVNRVIIKGNPDSTFVRIKGLESPSLGTKVRALVIRIPLVGTDA